MVANSGRWPMDNIGSPRVSPFRRSHDGNRDVRRYPQSQTGSEKEVPSRQLSHLAVYPGRGRRVSEHTVQVSGTGN